MLGNPESFFLGQEKQEIHYGQGVYDQQPTKNKFNDLEEPVHHVLKNIDYFSLLNFKMNLVITVNMFAF